jgi:adenylosuccinate synthase
MLNGYDSINITKLDILDTLPEIKIAVSYKLHGQEIHPIPASL